MILLIDNYDSFTFNLYQLIGTLQPDIRVVRNDELAVEEIWSLAPSHLVISPGPGRPEDAGICPELIARYLENSSSLQAKAKTGDEVATSGMNNTATDSSINIPILGVCLGHQVICQVLGATITYAPKLMHGKASRLTLDASSTLFAGLPHHIEGARYHSLVADAKTIPLDLRVTARDRDGTVMAVEHEELPLYGLQFHPESILTPQGKQIVKNFLTSTERTQR